MRAKVFVLVFSVVSLLAGGRVAVAHHSMAMFDNTRTVTYSGVVRKLQYSNPHIYIYVDVEKEGKVQLLRVECGSPQSLNRQGWSSKILQPGEKITIAIHPTKEGTNFGNLVSVTKADGKRLEAGSQGQQ